MSSHSHPSQEPTMLGTSFTEKLPVLVRKVRKIFAVPAGEPTPAAALTELASDMSPPETSFTGALPPAPIDAAPPVALTVLPDIVIPPPAVSVAAPLPPLSPPAPMALTILLFNVI